MREFAKWNLTEGLILSLKKQGVDQPTDIQAQAFPLIGARRDVWLSSPTGSGKTLAYLLPLLQQIQLETTDLQLVILAPTQELAVQIHACLNSLYPDKARQPRSQLLIGSASIQRQKEKLKQKPHIAVGSCGRMLELARDKKLKLHRCCHVVVDEADRMLDEENLPRLEQLLDRMDNDRQLVFASATAKSNAFQRAQLLGVDVQWVEGRDGRSKPQIDHYFIESPHHHKSDALRRLLHALKPEKAIVFLHKNETVELVQLKLERKELDMVMIHGARNKFEKEKALRHFRQGKARVLISSDVSARGLDIRGVTHVINLDAPSRSEDYLHRTGRTGRMGSKGLAVSILAPNEAPLRQRYEADLGIRIQPARVSEGKFVIE